MNLSLVEIQSEEKKILYETVKFLDKNHIKYYLWGGTLLGAIRHKGFIPWDDDIDIIVPRPDYNRMINLLNEEKTINHYQAIGFELGNSDIPFCKIINRDIQVECYYPIDQFLWIDIFPMDALPLNDNISYFDKVRKIHLKYTVLRSYAHHIKPSNFFKKIIKAILGVIYYNHIDYNKFITKYIMTASKYDYNKAKYVGSILWGIHPGNILEKDWLDDYKVEFEGMRLNAFKGYQEYLTNRYGEDYMMLPPAEKRATHNFIARRINNEKDKK